jgi:phospholipid/cholesterol/gamma-HCH transport system substrate-binding protein
MATRANYVKIGLFVILGFAAALSLAVGLGATRGHHDKVPFFTYLDESVQGLDVGAPVTFRGVWIGQVGAISVAPDHRLVAVRMDIDVNAMEDLDLVPRGDFRSGRGIPPPPSDLRAQLGSKGLTGTKFMSVDFFDPKTNPPPELSFPPPAHYMPAATSLMKSLEDSLAKLLDRADALVDRATGVVDGAGRIVAGLEQGGVAEKTSQALGDAGALVRGLNRIVASVDRARIVENAGATMESLRGGASDLDKIFARLDGDHGLVATTQRSLSSFGEAGRNVAGATRDLDGTLNDIREAAAAFRSLADELERQPDALIKGRAGRSRQ